VEAPEAPKKQAGDATEVEATVTKTPEASAPEIKQIEAAPASTPAPETKA
jgi:hypothetical protein